MYAESLVGDLIVTKSLTQQFSSIKMLFYFVSQLDIISSPKFVIINSNQYALDLGNTIEEPHVDSYAYLYEQIVNLNSPTNLINISFRSQNENSKITGLVVSVLNQCSSYCISCTTLSNCVTCDTSITSMSVSYGQNYCKLACPESTFNVITNIDTFAQTCQNCIPNCISCDNSLTCIQCQTSYYYDSNLKQCLPCHSSCQTCSQADSCTTCKTNLLKIDICYDKCPNNYKTNNESQSCDLCPQYTPDCQNCSKTCKFCQLNDSNVCLNCYDTMNLQNGQCLCKNGLDNRNIFYQCSYDSTAVLQGILDSDSPTLTINFGLKLKNDNLNCNQIFQQQSLNLFGSSPVCTINQTNISIALSNDATVMENRALSFIPNILRYENNNNFINNFYLVSFTQLRNQAVQLNFQYDKIQNTCNDIVFKYQSSQNDAQRGFSSFIWSIQMAPNPDQQTQDQVNAIVQNANNQKSLTLTIPKYLIPFDTSVTAYFQYYMKINVSGTVHYTTFYQRQKQIEIQTFQNSNSPIYRNRDLSFYFQTLIQVCDQTGPTILQESIDFQVSSNMLPILNRIYSQIVNQEVQVDVKKYQIPINSNFDLQVSAVLNSDITIKQQKNIQITPSLSNLLIEIVGGQNGMYNYQKDINLSGVARDFEIEDSNSPQGISLSWQCKSLINNNGDQKCYDYLNKEVILNQSTLSNSIPASTFNPYQTLQFTFSGSKDSRTSSHTITAMIAEFDIPPLIVSFQNQNQLQEVNLNEDILVSLIYGSNVSSDVLTYAGVVLYNNKEVGVITFDFEKVKFRIWDYFSQVVSPQNIVQVRFTAYNPSYYMPSMAVINFNINIPPKNCQFSVNPVNGQALFTNFTLQMNGCQSQNNPLTYQFFYYQNNNDYLQEIKSPNNILRRQISDQTFISSFTTLLPSGNLILMGQAMDSKLAVFNSTLQISISTFIQGEQQIISIIDQTLQQQSNYQTKQSLLNLCVLGEEISKNQPVYNLNSVNQRKQQLIQEIINKTNQLPKQSYLSTFSNKIISQLQHSLITQLDSQGQSVLDYINIVLYNQLILMQEKDNQLLNDNNIVIQNLVDSFKMLNSTTQTISFSLLPNQIKIADQICQLLSKVILPNTGGFQLQGHLISLDCQQITEKNLNQYLFTQTQIQSNITNIYQIAYSTYSQNPYEQTVEFQDYLKQLQQAQPNIVISKNPVILPSIEYINPDTRRFLSGNQGGSISSNSTFIYKFPNVKLSQNNLTCLQKQTNSWSSSKCQKVNYTDIGSYYCYCQEETATTVIDDLSYLIQNKNLKTAFSSQGVNNISNFSQFYRYAVFWLLAFITLSQVGLYFYGQKLDQKNMNQPDKVIQKVYPNNDISISQKISQDNKQDDQNKNNKKIEETPKDFDKNEQAKPDDLYQQYNNLDSNQQIFINDKFNQPIGQSPYISGAIIPNDQLTINSQNKNNFNNNDDFNMIDLEQQDEKNKFSLLAQQTKNIPEKKQLFTPQIEPQNSEQSSIQLQDKQQQIYYQSQSNPTLTKNTIQDPRSSIKIQERRDITHLQDNMKPDFQKISQANNQKITETLKLQNSQEYQNVSEKIAKNNEQNMQIDKENNLEEIQNETSSLNFFSEKMEKLFSKSLLQRVIIFHDFFNIFYTYDPTLSRAVRFNIFYLRIVHSLCLTTIFDESYLIHQKIAISIASSVILVVGVTLITILHKIKVIGKKLSSFFMVCLLLFYYYVVLSIISGEEANQSNSQTLSFLLIVGIDFLGTITFISIIKLGLIYFSKAGESQMAIINSIYKFLEINILIQNLNI